MYCSRCGKPNEDNSVYCAFCGVPLHQMNNKQFQQAQYNTNSLGGLIPYKNVPALVAYYCGLFSFIPILGAPLVIVAIATGCMGLDKARLNPDAKGKTHAIAGLCGACLGLVINGAIFIAGMSSVYG